MNMTKIFCGLLLASALGVGCKPRVRTIPDAVAETNPDGTTTVTHRHLGIQLSGLKEMSVAGAPNVMELSWFFGGSLERLTVKALDQHTAMTKDELKVDLELRGSSVQILEAKETEDGGFSATYTYRNNKFDKIGGHYSVKSVGTKKLVCLYTSPRPTSVRQAQGICESIKPYEAPAVAAKAESGKL